MRKNITAKHALISENHVKLHGFLFLDKKILSRLWRRKTRRKFKKKKLPTKTLFFSKETNEDNDDSLDFARRDRERATYVYVL